MATSSNSSTVKGGVSDSRPAWRQWFDEQRTAVDRSIQQHVQKLRAADVGHSRLLEAVTYSLVQGGKRVRPILVRESCVVCRSEPKQATLAALAVECIHTFSLIHDDLPAMDDDDLRRGVPTSHKVFGEAIAILAGDWLVAHAFALLADPEISPARSAALTRTLAGGSLGMVEGQGADIESEGKPPAAPLVEFIHLHKTARLIETCCRMGAICAGADEAAVSALGDYGRHLGLAFQITDDLLDRTATTAAMGKRTGKDADVSKQTYPAVFGIEQSRAQARQEVEAAAAALESFGERGQHLQSLARFVLERDH
ncbi:MAG: polyprenyl synthetase family protein [Phycisphaerae bacterium]|nr:polyprenyl synthetase family protein [Phycisphaerae bacterium]